MRSGMSVAVIGPDGAGKSTLVRSIAALAELPIELIYMGGNHATANRCLPITRWALGRDRPARVAGGAGGRETARGGGGQRALRAGGRLVLELVEYSYRFGLARAALRCGSVVLFDRYIYDPLIDSIADNGSRWQRLRAWIFARLFPPPDLMLILDAPGQLLFDRKAEHTPERLERVRYACRRVAAGLPRVVLIDATQPPTAVLHDALGAIQRCWSLGISRLEHA